MSFDPTVFWQQLTSPAYLQGAVLSVLVAVCALVLSFIVGLVIALMKLSPSKVLQALSNIYNWFFRSIPSMLLLLICWNALPQTFPIFRQDWYSPLVAASLGLGLGEAAYMAEALRASLISVPEGQALAGRALGMTPTQVLFKVVLPQAMRIAIPPIGNEFISLVKLSAIASVISLSEVLYVATVGVQATFRYAEYYSVAIIYYLVIVSLIMALQSWVERRFEWGKRIPKGRRLKLMLIGGSEG